MSQAAWQSYESGISCPGIVAALNIEDVTDGEIVVAHWREADSAKVVRKSKSAAKRASRSTKSA